MPSAVSTTLMVDLTWSLQSKNNNKQLLRIILAGKLKSWACQMKDG